MARPQAFRDDLKDSLQQLKALRDQIRVDLHLAGMEIRDEWKQLEAQLPDASRAGEQLKGMTAETLERLAEELERFRSRVRDKTGGSAVRDILTRRVATCRASDSLAAAITGMWGADVGFLPVIDDGGAVIGVITDRDAAIAACTRGKRMDDLSVDSAMSREIASCGPDDRVDDALALMRARRVRRLPVVDQERQLVGVVSLGDAARAGVAGVAAVLGAITEPHGEKAPEAN